MKNVRFLIGLFIVGSTGHMNAMLTARNAILTTAGLGATAIALGEPKMRKSFKAFNEISPAHSSDAAKTAVVLIGAYAIAKNVGRENVAQLAIDAAPTLVIGTVLNNKVVKPLLQAYEGMFEDADSAPAQTSQDPDNKQVKKDTKKSDDILSRHPMLATTTYALSYALYTGGKNVALNLLNSKFGN